MLPEIPVDSFLLTNFIFSTKLQQVFDESTQPKILNNKKERERRKSDCQGFFFLLTFDGLNLIVLLLQGSCPCQNVVLLYINQTHRPIHEESLFIFLYMILY